MTQQRQPLIRDMDLVRSLLIFIAETGNSVLPTAQPSSPDYSTELISYHLKIMHQQGLFEGTEMADRTWTVQTLTWSGQDFLTAAENNTVWDAAKEQAGTAFSALTLPILRELLTSVAKKMVGLS